MTDTTHGPDAIERRLSDAARRLLAQRASGAGSAADEGSAVAQIAEKIHRWMDAASMMRWFRTAGSDVLTAPGAEVELSAVVGPAVRLRAEQVVFEVAGRVVATAPIEPDRADVRASFVPAEAGVFPVIVRAVDREGRTVAGARGEEVARVFVVEDRPVVVAALFDVVDADGRVDARALGALDPWARAGVTVAYLTDVPPDRLVDLRGQMTRSPAPDGPILAPPELSQRVRALGVDFRTTFGAMAIRRARARGVAIEAVVGLEPTEALVRRLGCPVYDWDTRPTEADLTGVRGRGRRHRRRLREEEEAEFRVEQMTGAAAIDGNAVQVTFDGRAARTRWFELIESAQRTIHMQTYIFRAGRMADEIGARLVRRARAGVRVRILVDGLYGAPEAVLGRFGVLKILGDEPNVEVRLRDPVPFSRPSAQAWKHRDHRKILVIDGRVGIVGGRNIGDEYFGSFDEIAVGDWTPSDRIPWLDAHAEVRGPVAGALERAFVDAWTAQGDGDREGFVTDARGRAGETRVRVVLHEGLGDPTAVGLFEALFDAARERILVVNDFPVTELLADVLVRARRRGVRVVMLTGSAVARRGDGKMLPGSVHRELFEYMTKDRLEPLLRRGVEIFEYVAPPHERIVCTGGVVRPYVHAKVVTVDGRHATIGSANLDATTSYWEREANLVVHGAEAVGPIEAAIEGMLSRSRLLDPTSEEWAAETAFRRLARAVWPDALYS